MKNPTAEFLIGGLERFAAHLVLTSSGPGSDHTAECPTQSDALHTTYAYDEASRLTTINPPTGGAVTFTLDALDRHASRLVNAVTTATYGYLDASETAWGTGTGTPTSSLLDAEGTRLAVKTGSTVSWLLLDLHGSVVAMCTSGTSTLSDAYRFDGFGGQIASSGSATNPWRYRGLLNIGSDALTGALLDMGARDYLPQLGQFTQEDTVQGSAANPLTMNRFLYALANPATLIDPDGHATRGSPGSVGRPKPYHCVSSICNPTGTTGGGGGTGNTHPPTTPTPTDTALGPWSPWVPTPNGLVYIEGGGYVNDRGNIFTNLECLQWVGLPCASVMDPFRGYGSTNQLAELSGWSPLEYLAGTSTEGARNTLRLVREFRTGQETGNWWGFGLDAGALTARATLEGASVVGGFGALSLVGRTSSVGAATTGSAPAFARFQYGRMTAADRALALEKAPICPYCGASPSTQADHIIALKQDWESGGWADTRAVRTARANDPGNLIGACQTCNAAKGARLIGTKPGEWWPPGWPSGVWWPFGGPR